MGGFIIWRARSGTSRPTRISIAPATAMSSSTMPAPFASPGVRAAPLSGELHQYRPGDQPHRHPELSTVAAPSPAPMVPRRVRPLILPVAISRWVFRRPSAVRGFVNSPEHAHAYENVPTNLVLAGGNLILGPAFQNSGGITNLTLSGVTLISTNTVTGTFTWNGGTLAGPLTIGSGGLLNITGVSFCRTC